MVHLRNGTPEHRTEYHLLLSDLIPFDQNNCHLHRYHQFCHLHWRHRHSPSHQGFFGFKVCVGGFLDQIKCGPSRLRKSLIVYIHSNHHIHCFNATDILFTYLDILTPANHSAGTKIARFCHAIIDVWREGTAVLQSMMIHCIVSKEIIYLKLKMRKEQHDHCSPGPRGWHIILNNIADVVCCSGTTVVLW